MPGPLRRRRAAQTAAATAALIVAASVGGCSSDSDQPEASDTTSSPSETTSPSPAPSPSASSSPEPKLPKAPAAKDTAAGRAAFADFVIARWGYALETNDATALTDLSPESGPCEGCPELQAELRTRTKEGWHVDFPGARIVKMRIGPGDVEGVQVATATINVPASTSYFDDGELRNENEAHKGATFEVRMRLDGKRYALLAFRVS
jgi:hypothetical protein